MVVLVDTGALKWVSVLVVFGGWAGGVGVRPRWIDPRARITASNSPMKTASFGDFAFLIFVLMLE